MTARECSFFVGGHCQTAHRGRQPFLANLDGLEWIAEDVPEQGTLNSPLVAKSPIPGCFFQGILDFTHESSGRVAGFFIRDPLGPIEGLCVRRVRSVALA